MVEPGFVHRLCKNVFEEEPTVTWLSRRYSSMPLGPHRWSRIAEGGTKMASYSATWSSLAPFGTSGLSIEEAAMISKSFDSPDESRTPDKTEVAVVQLGDVKAARFTMQPGWRWSECVKPVAGTDSCQARHVGAAVSGRMHVIQNDGSEAEVGPGEAYIIDPGHDAWVVGDEPFVGYEFESQTAATYAVPRT
jgi:hypothetical protein